MAADSVTRVGAADNEGVAIVDGWAAVGLGVVFTVEHAESAVLAASKPATASLDRTGVRYRIVMAWSSSRAAAPRGSN